MKIDGELVWRTMLPLSLSYDHRVINGADAAKFCVEFAKAISKPESWVVFLEGRNICGHSLDNGALS